MAQRVIVVTGSASGIGKATADLLLARGERVIGVDLKDADVIADLSTLEGCEVMAEKVAAHTDRIDAIIANAGVLGPDALCYAVNYFGVIRTIETLRSLLLRSNSPRIAITASMASGMTMPIMNTLLPQLERGETPEAVDVNGAAYATSKVAICRWMRRVAALPEWADRQIPINAVAPGVVDTPMGNLALKDPATQAVLTATPMGRKVKPEEIGEVLAFLASEANSFMSGQTIFVDGALNARLRPNHV